MKYLCTMKTFIFILVTVLLLKPVLPFLEYAVNYDYITQVLCENKAAPELECNGKCHLMKELAKASEDEKPLSSHKKSMSESEVLFFQEFQQNVVFTSTPSFVMISNFYLNNYSLLLFDSSYRPPTLA